MSSELKGRDRRRNMSTPTWCEAQRTLSGRVWSLEVQEAKAQSKEWTRWTVCLYRTSPFWGLKDNNSRVHVFTWRESTQQWAISKDKKVGKRRQCLCRQMWRRTPGDGGVGGKRTTSALLTVGSRHLEQVLAHSNCWINADGMNKWLRDAEKQIQTRKGWKYMFKEEEGERNQCFWVMGTQERELEASKDDRHVFWSSDKTCTKGVVKAYNWKKQVCKTVLPRTKYWIKNSEWIQSLDFQEDKLLKMCHSNVNVLHAPELYTEKCLRWSILLMCFSKI